MVRSLVVDDVRVGHLSEKNSSNSSGIKQTGLNSARSILSGNVKCKARQNGIRNKNHATFGQSLSYS